MPYYSKSKKVREALEAIAERLAGDKPQGPLAAQQRELLRLARKLVSYVFELEAVNHQLPQNVREFESSTVEFRQLHEFVPTARVQLGRDGTIQRVNENALEIMSGQAVGTVLGRDFKTFVQSEDLGVFLRHLRRTDGSKLSPVFKLRLVNADGQPLRIHCQVSHENDPRGRFSHWQLAFLDVTVQQRFESALRASEEHLELATRAGCIGIWVTDFTTGYSHWNEQLYQLLGLEPRVEPENRDAFFEFIHPADRSNVLESTRKLLHSGRGFQRDFRIVRADDGRVRWLASRGDVQRDDNGRPIRMQGVNFDITERKQTEEALKAANKELNEFAYALTHNIKAPFRAIQNYAQFLSEDLKDILESEQKQFLQGIKTAAIQANNQFQDMESLYRIKNLIVESELFDLSELLNEMQTIFKDKSGCELIIAEQLPVLNCCKYLLRQILLNLIINGFKYNLSNEKQVKVDWQPAGNGRFEILVHDNGIGINREYHNQIFGMFKRLHTEREYEGTGMGLAIAAKAAQRLDGTLRVKSAVGEGSTFYVNLPNSILQLP